MSSFLMPKRGGTNAHIFERNGMVYKFSDNAFAQAQWLMVHETWMTPHVFNCDSLHSFYTMEKLDIPPVVLGPRLAKIMFHSIWIGMTETVWQAPARHLEWDQEAMNQKLKTLVTKYNLEDVYQTLLIHWPNDDAIIKCLSHGDTTWDNIMVRKDDKLGDNFVYIDPLPSSPAIPDRRAVDTGKMLQSIVGYERAKYGVLSPWVCPVPVEKLGALIHDAAEWNATVWWCIVHLLRRFPYADDYEYEGLKELINAAVTLF